MDCCPPGTRPNHLYKQKQKHWKRESSLHRILSVVYEVKVGHDDENEFNTVSLMVTISPEWQMTVIDMAAERINPAEQPTPEFLLGRKNPFKTFLLQSYSDVLFWLPTYRSELKKLGTDEQTNGSAFIFYKFMLRPHDAPNVLAAPPQIPKSPMRPFLNLLFQLC